MGSVKCTLRKEVKNEIAKYIDNEFKCIREKWDVKEYIQKSII